MAFEDEHKEFFEEATKAPEQSETETKEVPEGFHESLGDMSEPAISPEDHEALSADMAEYEGGDHMEVREATDEDRS